MKKICINNIIQFKFKFVYVIEKKNWRRVKKKKERNQRSVSCDDHEEVPVDFHA